VFITSLAFFVTPAFIGGRGNMTISMLIESTFRGAFDFSGASAMGAMLLLATLLVYVLADRYLKVGDFWGG
jgi:putative spermidine/putrescine transport system permease protein